MPEGREPYRFLKGKDIIEEYEEELEKFEDLFFELEKIKPVDFETIFIILPHDSKRKKKTIIWGFSLAKRCSSKAVIVARVSETVRKIVEDVSKTMNVPYDFLSGNIEDVIEKLKAESGRSIIVLPKDSIPGLKEEKSENPIFVV